MFANIFVGSRRCELQVGTFGINVMRQLWNSWEWPIGHDMRARTHVNVLDGSDRGLAGLDVI